MKTDVDRKRLFADTALILGCLLLAGLLFFLTGRRPAGEWAVVRVDGEEQARYPLAVDGVYELNGGTNVLTIADGAASMTFAACPDRLCVKMGKISRTGQCITCLPNRVTVTVEGGEAEFDAMT